MTSDRNRPILDEHECSRLAKKGTQNEDGRVDGEAFRLREREPFLSVNCIDFHDGETREARIGDLRAVVIRELNIRTQILALFEVGNTVEYVRERSDDRRELMIDHQWEEGNHSHCGVHGFVYGEDIIADLMAETVLPENVMPVKTK